MSNFTSGAFIQSYIKNVNYQSAQIKGGNSRGSVSNSNQSAKKSESQNKSAGGSGYHSHHTSNLSQLNRQSITSNDDILREKRRDGDGEAGEVSPNYQTLNTDTIQRPGKMQNQNPGYQNTLKSLTSTFRNRLLPGGKSSLKSPIVSDGDNLPTTLRDNNLGPANSRRNTKASLIMGNENFGQREEFKIPDTIMENSLEHSQIRIKQNRKSTLANRRDKIKHLMQDTTNYSKDLLRQSTSKIFGDGNDQSQQNSYWETAKVLSLKLDFNQLRDQNTKRDENQDVMIKENESNQSDHQNSSNGGDGEEKDQINFKKRLSIDVPRMVDSANKPPLDLKNLHQRHGTDESKFTFEDTSDINQSSSLEPAVKLPFRARLRLCWENFKFYPNSSFKMKWDLIVILLSIWNSIAIPYEFAFPDAFEENVGFMVADYFIDLLFAFDILINFRSVYLDPKTEEPVDDGKKIALNYLFKGRFVIDIFASTPFEVIQLIFSGDSNNLKFLGMLKLVRLLRLGRMITYLKTNRSFKFGMKIIQLLFMLLLIIHWIASFWYMITSSIQDWFPPKDLDFRTTEIYNDNRFTTYTILFYYATLTLVGAELLPSSSLEVGFAALIILLGSIIIGTIIGEFSTILSEIQKKARQQNEEVDMVQAVMSALKIPEGIQARTMDYYEFLINARFVRKDDFYDSINISLGNTIKLYQVERAIRKMGLFDQHNMTQIEKFAQNVHIEAFQQGDVIIKQGDTSTHFFVIVSGLVEVALEVRDFQFFDFDEAQNFIQRVPTESELDDTEGKGNKNQLTSSMTGVGFLERKRTMTTAFPIIKLQSMNAILPRKDTLTTSHRLDSMGNLNHPKVEDRYKVVNELKEGNFFGEIGLMTNLRRTCSVFAVDATTCGLVNKEDFQELVNTNADFRNKVTTKINSYKDQNFKFLVTMVRNVFAFRSINSKVLRNIVYALKQKSAPKGGTILRRGEYNPATYFIKQGKVLVYVKDEHMAQSNLDVDLSGEFFQKNTQSEWYHFSTLNKGSSFNLVGSFLKRPSLFYFIAAERDTQFLTLEFEDFQRLTQRSESLSSVTQTVKAAYEKDHIKYDFGRMVFANIHELIRAQRLKAQYEEQQEEQEAENQGDSPNALMKDHGDYSPNSPVSPFKLNIDRLKHLVGTGEHTESFKVVKAKFWKITKRLRAQKFHISQLRVFELIDEAYEANIEMEKKAFVQRIKKMGAFKFQLAIQSTLLGGILNLQPNNKSPDISQSKKSLGNLQTLLPIMENSAEAAIVNTTESKPGSRRLSANISGRSKEDIKDFILNKGSSNVSSDSKILIDSRRHTHAVNTPPLTFLNGQTVTVSDFEVEQGLSKADSQIGKLVHTTHDNLEMIQELTRKLLEQKEQVADRFNQIEDKLLQSRKKRSSNYDYNTYSDVYSSAQNANDAQNNIGIDQNEDDLLNKSKNLNQSSLSGIIGSDKHSAQSSFLHQQQNMSFSNANIAANHSHITRRSPIDTSSNNPVDANINRNVGTANFNNITLLSSTFIREMADRGNHSFQDSSLKEPDSQILSQSIGKSYRQNASRLKMSQNSRNIYDKTRSGYAPNNSILTGSLDATQIANQIGDQQQQYDYESFLSIAQMCETDSEIGDHEDELRDKVNANLALDKSNSLMANSRMLGMNKTNKDQNHSLDYSIRDK